MPGPRAVEALPPIARTLAGGALAGSAADIAFHAFFIHRIIPMQIPAHLELD
jgi:hypothetical protein